MFTGIVEETGIVQAIRPGAGGIGLWVRASRCGRGLKTGDSLAINGCCLTVEKIGSQPGGKLLQFTVLNETWQRTNLQFAAAGASVNLERALRVGDPLGGHFCHRAHRQPGKNQPMGADGQRLSSGSRRASGHHAVYRFQRVNRSGRH